MISVRFDSDVARQAGKAALAAATAARPPRPRRSRRGLATAPGRGVVHGPSRPDVPATTRPPIQWLMRPRRRRRRSCPALRSASWSILSCHAARGDVVPPSRRPAGAPSSEGGPRRGSGQSAPGSLLLRLRNVRSAGTAGIGLARGSTRSRLPGDQHLLARRSGRLRIAPAVALLCARRPGADPAEEQPAIGLAEDAEDERHRERRSARARATPSRACDGCDGSAATSEPPRPWPEVCGCRSASLGGDPDRAGQDHGKLAGRAIPNSSGHAARWSHAERVRQEAGDDAPW